MAEEAVSILTVRGNPVGLDRVEAGLRNVEAAQKDVVASSTKVEQRSLSVEGALRRVERQFDATARAQQDMARVTRTLDRALAQGLVTEERRSQVLALAEEKMRRTSAVNDNVARTTGNVANQIQQLGFQVQDVAASLASGSSPFTILFQQGGQVYSALDGPGGVGQGLRNVGGYLRGLVTPATVAGTALVGAAALAFTSWSRFDDMQRQVLGTLQGVGRQVGLTTAQFQALGERAAQAGGLSVAQATDVANTLARTGQLNAANIERITALTKSFAATFTSGDIAQAQQMLADMFKAPEEGVQRLLSLLPGVSVLDRKRISDLVEQGDRQKAVAEGINVAALNMARFDETVSRTSGLWDKIKGFVSDVDLSIGRLIDRAQRAAFAQPSEPAPAASPARGGRAAFARAMGLAPDPNRGILTNEQFGPVIPNDQASRMAMGLASKAAEMRASLENLDFKYALEEIQKYKSAVDATIETRSRLTRQHAILSKVLQSENEDVKAVARANGFTNEGLLRTEEALRTLIPAEEQRARLRANELAAAREENPIARARIEAQRVYIEQAGKEVSESEKTAEAQHKVALAREFNTLQIKRLNQDMEMQRQMLAAEAASIGMSDTARAALIAGLQMEQQLRRQGIVLTDAQRQALVKEAEDLARQRAELQRLQQIWSSMEGIASGAFASLARDFSSGVGGAQALANALKGVADQLTAIGTKELGKGLMGGLQGLLGGKGMSGFSFDPVSLGIGAAGLGLSFIAGQEEQRKAKRENNIAEFQRQMDAATQAMQEAQRKQVEAAGRAAEEAARAAEEAQRRAAAVARRSEGFADRAFMAGLDTSTLEGRLAQFDRQAQREREEEIRAGGEAIAALEQALYAERNNIARDFHEQQLKQIREFYEQQNRTIQSFIDELKGGAASTLSPEERFRQAGAAFERQFAAAMSGDQNAYASITEYARRYLDAARMMYGSSQEYQNIERRIIRMLQEMQGATGGTVQSLDPFPPPSAANTNVPLSAMAPLPSAGTSDALGELRSLRTAVENQAKEIAWFRRENGENIMAGAKLVREGTDATTEAISGAGNKQAQEVRMAAARQAGVVVAARPAA